MVTKNLARFELQDPPRFVIIIEKLLYLRMRAEEVTTNFASEPYSVPLLLKGLYLAKELVTRHGGHIWVESTEGKGSTFFVRLPLGHKVTTSQ